MISIPGSIGKYSSIISFLLEGEDTTGSSNRKRRRSDRTHDNHSSSMDKTVQFPVSTAEFEYSLLQDIWRASKNTEDELDIQWHFQRLSDTTMASMKVFKNQECLVENEQLVMTDRFDENTISTFEEGNQLFTAIVFASYHQLISVSFAKLVLSSDDMFGLILLLEFTVDSDRVKKSKYIRLMSALSQILPLEDEKDKAVSKKKKKTTNVTLNTASSSSSSSVAADIMDLVPTHNEQSTSYISKSKPTLSIPTDVSLEAFYNNLQPPVSDQLLEHYVAPTILAQLTPFQTQNIEWMMKREGHFVTESGEPKPLLEKPCPLLYGYDKQSDLYTNLFSGKTISDKKEIKRLTENSLQGGILADEMGLGKTLSILGLVAKHKWSEDDRSHPNPKDFPKLIFSKGTLVIVPGSIISQWVSEAKRHAPDLSVYEYKGAADETISNEELATYDIVLVHYEKFRSEISHSKAPPPRPRRHASKYKFRLSPLVSVLWFRVILDEAQMVESLKAKTAMMAQRIPRWYSWAVTGTPMKSSYSDLFGLYKFLELEETVSDSEGDFCQLHRNLQYKGLFFDFIKATMRRNMKSALTNQVFIPKQTRHVVHIPLSTIEQHYYEDIWEKCKELLHLDWLDSIGWQLPEDASEESKRLLHHLKSGIRPLLLALRQSCIHPSLVANTLLRLGHTLGTNNSRNISDNSRTLSMSDVLNDMARDAKTKYNGKQLVYYATQLRHGGMYEVMEKWQKAADIYLKNLPQVEELLKLHVEEMEAIQSKKKVSDLNVKKVEEEEHKRNITALASTINRWYLLLHQYCFYLGGIFHTIKNEELERMYYQQAADVRRLLLEKQATKVGSALQELKKAGLRIKLSQEERLGRREFDEDILKYKVYDEQLEEEDDEYDPKKGDIMMVKNLKQIGEILDNQYDKIVYLREKTTAILFKPLVDSDGSEDMTGDEYENSLNDQALCQVYISAYQALLQDRKFIVKGIVNSLSDLPSNDYEVVSPEAKKVEEIEIEFRKSLKSPGFQIQCLKDIEFFLRSLKGSMRKNESSKEANVLYKNHEWIKSIIPRQYKIVDNLEVDIRKLSQLFNNRIAYYKSLQTISDTLLEWKHSAPEEEMKKIVSSSTKLQEEIATSKSRYSYFQALTEEQEKLNLTGKGKERKDCLICLNPIEKGMITYCGHTSCFNCGIRWFREHPRCHTCNSNVNRNEWYKISYREAEMHDRDAPRHHSIASSSKASNKANEIYETPRNQGQLQEIIQQINAESIVEGQGAKLDRIIRHIKFIKNDTNGKCVVFSQWTKVLDMLRIGLTANGIRCVTLTAGVNKANVTKFQENPSINVILLHARSQSSGLTLVAAQTVFIVEPVFNETLERQAINRVHRIGQKKQTSVFWYIVQDTVEERIQLIHDRERNRKIRTGTNGIEDNLTLTSLTDGGGEYVNDNELRSCFTSVQAYI